jgi:hypothetical protein
VAFGAVCVAVATSVLDGDDDALQQSSRPVIVTVAGADVTDAPDPTTSTTAAAAPPGTEPAGATPSTPAEPPASTAPATTAAPASSAPATTAPATTPPPTTAPANTVPAPGATVFDGSGNFVIELAGIDVAGTIVAVTHSGSEAFELSALDGELNQLELIESVVGEVSGTYPLGFAAQSLPSYLRIDADGAWHIEVRPVDAARVWEAESVSGNGPDVLRFGAGPSVLDYTSSGASNFVVEYHRDPGYDLLVNEIAPVTGSTTMAAGPGVVVVDAQGEWTLTARPA